MREGWVSVVVVTKNRENVLVHCLGSLASQTKALDELVVVDNDSSDNTKERVLNFKELVNFPVRLVREEGFGYPVIYNRGLDEVRGEFVAFIDDDCVASKNWYEIMKDRALIGEEGVVAFLGSSDVYEGKSTSSLLSNFCDALWKRNKMEDEEVVDLEILDNKNIVYDRRFLKKNNLKYDESRVGNFMGAGEDCDLGMQIQKTGGKAVYVEDAKVFHKEPDNWRDYYKKVIFSSRSLVDYEIKWGGFRKKVEEKVKNSGCDKGVYSYMLGYIQDKGLGVFKSIGFFVHFQITKLVGKGFRLFQKKLLRLGGGL